MSPLIPMLPIAPTQALHQGPPALERVRDAASDPRVTDLLPESIATPRRGESVGELSHRLLIPTLPIAPTQAIHQATHPTVFTEPRNRAVVVGTAVSFAGITLLIYGADSGSDACQLIGFLMFLMGAIICAPAHT
jgi:hypothetical protein